MRLQVRNFGVLKDIDIRLTPMTVFIGEERSGKSTLLKLIYGLANRSGVAWEFKESPYFASHWVHGKTHIELSADNGEPLFMYTSERLFTPKNCNMDGMSELEKMFTKSIQYRRNEDIIYIPSERNLFSVYSNLELALALLCKEHTQNLVYHFVHNLYTDLVLLRRQLSGRDEIDLPVVGKISLKDFKQRLRFDNCESSLKFLLTMLIPIYSLSYSLSQTVCLIEEPELGLYPKAQSKVARWIVGKIGQAHNMLVVMSTHSPYILTELNTLIQAHNAASASLNYKSTDKVIPRHQWIDFNDVSLYNIVGGCSSEAKNYKNKLLDNSIIDEVSDDNEIEFSRLLDIEFGGGNRTAQSSCKCAEE